ncbi:MAG: proline dehydrogenase family protein [Flavobacteriaceae bacterium]
MLFDNTKRAFSLKSNYDLKKALIIFKLISNKRLVNLGSRIVNLLKNLNLSVNFLFKETIFKQFCAGINKKETLNIVKKLSEANIYSYVHYASENIKTEEDLDVSLKQTLLSFDFSRLNKNISFVVFKPTSLGFSEIYEKHSLNKLFKSKEIESLRKIEHRFKVCCEKARILKVKLLIDAEESWIQNSIDILTEKLMEKYNKKKVIVYTTIQMYRKDRYDYLVNLYRKALKKKFKIGVKLVRGAYIEKELNRSKLLGYDNPIYSTKEETDKSFNNAVNFILKRLQYFSIFLATHNEKSIYNVIKFMNKNNISKKSEIYFSQLYGMGDNITFNLAHLNYKVVKYLPYGPIRDVIPYLIRRAQENTSVSGQTSREMDLIKKERKRRKVN